MKRTTGLVVPLSLIFSLSSPAWASADADIAAANAAAKSVFLIVTEGGASGIDLARRVAGEAQNLAADTAVLEMDRADRANAAVVKRYRLESVPVPLILVIGANGAAAGGARPHLVTASRLARMVPSPAKAAHLKALDEKKASFLVFARESMAARAGALQAATAAVAVLKGAAVLTSIDLDASKEAGFIAEMQVASSSAAPVTIVFNAKGQRISTIPGVATPGALAEAATKEISECCPGGQCK